MIQISLQIKNKTGLQTVPRPVEQVHYFGGWVEGAKSLWCQGFADRQTYRTGGGARYIEVGKKLLETGQTGTHTQTDRQDWQLNRAFQCECSKQTFKMNVLRKNHWEV